MTIPHQKAHSSGKPACRSLIVAATLIFLAACSSSDDPTTGSTESPSKSTKASNATHSSPALPDFFPDKIPLPDDHVIVRDSSRMTDELGREIELNIALPGSLEEWTETYQSALREAFQDVEFRESRGSLQWRFHGQGFEYGALYISENQGHLDRGSTDSSHLPIMLSIKMLETRPAQ